MWSLLMTAMLPVLVAIKLLMAFMIAYIAIYNGYAFPSNSLMNDYQGYLYYGGMRKIWQSSEDCIQYDKDLLYVPKIGSCQFTNTEFKTKLNFNNHGRKRPEDGYSRKNSGIAVIGDSHAMGWGVNDSETFSYILEKNKGIPVYNLSVASYGTYRELLRLEKTGLLSSINTIIIQYCENDLEENKKFLKSRLKFEIEEFNTMITHPNKNEEFEVVKMWISAAFKIGYDRFFNPPNENKNLNFSDHIEDFINIVKIFEWTKNKKIIVIYSNAHGKKFENFESFKVNELQNIRFVELNMNKNHYYTLDDHLNKSGHKYIADKLSIIIN